MVTALVALLLSQDAGAGFTLTVKIEGLSAKTGKLFVSLHDKAASWPGKSELAVRRMAVDPADTVVLENVPAGTWAVSVVHDVNGNGKVDTNFLGIPKEPVGVSNDAKGRFGPPKFDDAKFKLERDMTITIHMI